MLFGVPYPILTQKSKKNIGGGIGAPSFSAVGLILLGHWQKQKTALVCVAESDHTYLQKYNVCTANDYRQTTDKLIFKHVISTLR